MGKKRKITVALGAAAAVAAGAAAFFRRRGRSQDQWTAYEPEQGVDAQATADENEASDAVETEAPKTAKKAKAKKQTTLDD